VKQGNWGKVAPQVCLRSSVMVNEEVGQGCILIKGTWDRFKFGGLSHQANLGLMVGDM
jgi:hypothetical protein